MSGAWWEPEESVMRDRVTAYEEVERRLGAVLRPDGLRVSPLGPGYSSDVDAYVKRTPDPAELMRAGWLPLDRLLGSVGIRETGRWAVVVDGRVVGAADIHVSKPPDPVQHILDRCRRQGAGPREVAELDALRARGFEVGRIPRRRPSAPLRHVVGAVRRRARPRVVVSISGVDGAGKSTLSRRLVDDLTRAGVPATRVWVRPGVTSGPVHRLSRLGKRVLGEDTAPGLRRAAAGEAKQLRSRRGLVGRLWRAVIAWNFAVELLRQYAGATGVVVFDRHRVDAEVTLEVLYPGRRDFSWRIARKAIPAADLTTHLDISADEAVARKPDDPIGQWAVERQLEVYDEMIEDDDDDVVMLDAQQTPDHLARQMLERLTLGQLR